MDGQEIRDLINSKDITEVYHYGIEDVILLEEMIMDEQDPSFKSFLEAELYNIQNA
ncbi:MAG: hypothetical protein ACRDBG_01760 [Waterburya sp.]